MKPNSPIVRNGLVFITVVFALTTNDSPAQTTLPPVVVTGTESPNTVCRDDECEGIARGQPGQPTSPPPADPGTGPDNREAYCRRLRSQKPAGCGNAAPPVPGVNTTREAYARNYANGCTDGSWRTLIANQLARAVIGSYSGDANQPWRDQPQLSFRTVCDAHDACYAGQEGFVHCNNAFRDNMMATCRERFQNSTECDTCYLFARGISLAVREGGYSSYTEAGHAHLCARWHKNMEDHGCR